MTSCEWYTDRVVSSNFFTMNDNVSHEVEIQKLQEVNAYVTVRWLLAALFDWGLIIGAMACAIISGNIWVYIIAVFVIGNRIQGLALLGHEGAHYLVSRNKVLNDFLSNIFTFYAYGFNIYPYRKMHINHHLYLGSQLDPELDEKRKTPTAWDLPMSKREMFKQFFHDLFFGAIKEEMSFITWLGKPKNSMDFFIHTLWYIVVLGSIYYFAGPIVLVKVIFLWEISVTSTFWAMFRLRMYTEHMGTENAYRIAPSWWQKILFLPHGTWHHWEHHANFHVPFFRLPLLRKLMDRPDVPIRSLNDVFASYATMPNIPSGTPLRSLPEDGSVTVKL